MDVLPILGYLMNRGKCHFCQKKIAITHLIVEILGGILYTTAYLLLGFELELMVAIILISVLLIESISDAESMTVIDRIWLIGLVPLIAIRIIQGRFWDHLLSSAILFTFLYLMALLAKWIAKKEAFGGGDIKLYLFIGMGLTLQQNILSLFIASLLGLVYALFRKNKNTAYIALVPFIFMGVMIAYYFGDSIIESYLRWLGMGY
jgi:prepilin signal peptidase PulO-like enzyme (type II secretory pathway)